jgi:hypothetical protein
MSEIGSERVERSARVPERLEQQPRTEPRARGKRPREQDSDSGSDDGAEIPTHQIDSLA